MRAWAIVLAVAVVQCCADEDPHRKSRKVGSFVETIGAGDLAVKENGKARFTFWEKTSPDMDKPKVSCGLKTNVPGNYTLEIVRPDLSREIFLVTVERAAGEKEGFLRAYFPVKVVNIRPSEIHIRLLQGMDDEDGQLIGTVQITQRPVPRTKRNEADRQVIRKMSKIVRKDKNKKANDKLKVHEYQTSSEVLQENFPVRQAENVVRKQGKKMKNTRKQKRVKSKKMKAMESKNRAPEEQQKKKGGKKKARKEKGSKNENIEMLPAENLRLNHIKLRASGEAFENPKHIELIRHRRPKSVLVSPIAENANLENSPIELRIKYKAGDKPKIGEV